MTCNGHRDQQQELNRQRALVLMYNLGVVVGINNFFHTVVALLQCKYILSTFTFSLLFLYLLYYVSTVDMGS